MPGRFSSLMRPRWWTLLLLPVAVILLAGYLHWDDRLHFWFKQQQSSPAEQQASIWLPGYRAVLQGKPVQGLEDDELSGLKCVQRLGGRARGRRFAHAAGQNGLRSNPVVRSISTATTSAPT